MFSPAPPNSATCAFRGLDCVPGSMHVLSSDDDLCSRVFLGQKARRPRCSGCFTGQARRLPGVGLVPRRSRRVPSVCPACWQCALCLGVVCRPRLVRHDVRLAPRPGCRACGRGVRARPAAQQASTECVSCMLTVRPVCGSGLQASSRPPRCAAGT